MKSKFVKLMVSSLVITVMAASLVACGGKNKESEKISISGSTSVGPLMEKLAEKYKEKNQGISIEINQTGSSAGIKDAINGVSNLGMASRDLKDEEKLEVIGREIAYDGIAVILNNENKVKNLTKEQIKDIYTGKITNWKEVGGDDAQIVAISREEGSGTRTAFQEIIGYKSEELIKDAQIVDGSGGIKTTVSGNKNAIGFVSFEYLDDSIVACKVDGVDATVENVIDKTYKLSRSFVVVNKKDSLTDASEKFIEWILSDEGQAIVEENKAIRVK